MTFTFKKGLIEIFVLAFFLTKYEVQLMPYGKRRVVENYMVLGYLFKPYAKKRLSYYKEYSSYAILYQYFRMYLDI